MSNEGPSPPDNGPDFETRFEVDEDSPSWTILRTVAALRDVKPDNIGPLYESIDPDALDMLFQSDTTEILVQFQFEGYRIEIESEGTIRLYELESAPAC